MSIRPHRIERAAFENFLLAHHERHTGVVQVQSRPFMLLLDPASTCQATCARESQCKAWSLSEATSTPTCHLKSSIGGTSFKPRIVSGLKGLEFTAGLAP